MLWFDAHLDLAYLAVSGRDMLAPLDALGEGAGKCGPHPPAAVTLPELAEAGVRLALGTVFTEPDGKGAEGYPAGDVERAAAKGRAQVEVYLTWRELGRVGLDLRRVCREDRGVGKVRGGMGVAEVVPAPVEERLEGHDRRVLDESLPLRVLGLPDPVLAKLSDARVRTVGHLAQLSETDLLKMRGVGRTVVRTIEQALAARGMRLNAGGPLHLGILVENADPIRSPEELGWWVERGVVAVGLAWAKPSRYAGGNGTELGLTDLGRAMVGEMDRLGVVHDLSHLSDRAMDELLALTERPVIASHSNCRSLVPGSTLGETQRHLRDGSIREIARRGGVVGLNLFSKFLRRGLGEGERATIDDCVDHVERVCEVAGSRGCVGLGSDMDGGFSAARLPAGVDRAGDLGELAEGLSARGWSDEEVEGFAWGNWVRFWGGGGERKA